MKSRELPRGAEPVRGCLLSRLRLVCCWTRKKKWNVLGRSSELACMSSHQRLRFNSPKPFSPLFSSRDWGIWRMTLDISRCSQFSFGFCQHHSPNECLRWLKMLMKNYCRDFFSSLLRPPPNGRDFFSRPRRGKTRRRNEWEIIFLLLAAWQNCQANFSHIYHLGLINLRRREWKKSRREQEEESLSCSTRMFDFHSISPQWHVINSPRRLFFWWISWSSAGSRLCGEKFWKFYHAAMMLCDECSFGEVWVDWVQLFDFYWPN